MLPFKCLNAQGWVLSKIHGRWVNLLNNEKYATQEYYDLVLNEKGELEGHATVAFTGYDAVNLRRLLHNEGEAGFMEKKITRAGNLLVSNVKFVDLDSLHLPLRITFDIAFSHTLRNVNRLVFFKPLISIFGDYINPWIKDERMFPIDHGCPSTEILNCRIQLPDHYDPEELPENIRIQMPDNDASFMFAASSLGNSLNIACELRIRKTFFGVEKYPAYQEFYTLINKKCNEMVILKEK
jgi:hypothetical protein